MPDTGNPVYNGVLHPSTRLALEAMWRAEDQRELDLARRYDDEVSPGHAGWIYSLDV